MIKYLYMKRIDKLTRVLAGAYIPLVDGFPTVVVEGTGSGLATFLNYAFTITIGLVGILAVLMIIWGGVQYVSTDAWSGKEDGKKKIQAALGGLILALSTYLILNTIDPNLTRLTFDIKQVDLRTPTGQIGVDGSAGGPTTGVPGAGPGGVTTPPIAGEGQVNGIPTAGAYNPTIAAWADSLCKTGKPENQKYCGIKNETMNRLAQYQGVDYVAGKASTFGGPLDTGVTPTETGAISGEILRNLNPNTLYIAGRWDYKQTPKSALESSTVEVVNPVTGKRVTGNIRIVDWGPNVVITNKSWDLSPGLMSAIGGKSGDEVYVRFVK